MQEFVLTAPRTLTFRDYEDPPLKPDQVRVKAVLSGIKHGTEIALYRGNTPFVGKRFDTDLRIFLPSEDTPLYPANLAAWDVAEITEVGAAVTGFAVGERVHCRMPHRPTNVVNAALLHKLGDLAPERATFTDPATVALLAVHDAEIKVGDNIAIYGLGAIGLLAVQLARMSGARRVIAVDPVEARRQMALDMGADLTLDPTQCDAALEIKLATERKGTDATLEISGSYVALQDAIRSLRPCGTLVPCSFYSGKGTLELGSEWHHNRITVKSSSVGWGMPHRDSPLWDSRRLEETCIDLLTRGLLQVDAMQGRSYRYADAANAYAFIDQHPDAGVKTFLTYDEVQ
jgi:threonine dehydrogenase-like Zn-dependent dehydrogenase